MIGRVELREGGRWGRCKQHIKHSFQGDFCTEKIIKKQQQQEWASTEQASNETVAKNFWRYLLSNPDRYIYIKLVFFPTVYSLFFSLNREPD